MELAPNKKTPEARVEPPRAFQHEEEHGEGLSTGRYEPRDLDELMRYCKIVVQSQLCPRHIKSPADAMLIIQRGAELGLTAVTALQNLNVISGNVTMPAALAVGIVKASEACEYFTCVESADEYSTWETKRRGNPEPTRYTFSRRDAEVAGLWGSAIWKKYPRNLLAARASMNLARMEYQDVLVGVYTPEELEVSVAARPAPRPSEPARPTSEPARSTSEPAAQVAQAIEPASDTVQPATELAEQPAQPGDATAPQAQRPLHWSETPLKNARDHARTKAWQAQNERFHALARTGDVEALCQPLRQFIKERHNAAAWGMIPADLMGKWCDLLEKYDSTPDAAVGALSPRAQWVEHQLTRHAQAKAGITGG